MHITYRIALWCGLAPLISGAAVFLIWLVVRNGWLQIAGFIIFILGLVLFVVGIMSLLIYLYTARKNKIEHYIKRSFVAGSILVVNFPVAALLMFAFFKIAYHQLIIVNESEHYITKVEISGPVRHWVNSISPRTTYKSKIYPDSEGNAHYQLLINGFRHEGVLGLIDEIFPETRIMTITESGEIEVE